MRVNIKAIQLLVFLGWCDVYFAHFSFFGERFFIFGLSSYVGDPLENIENYMQCLKELTC